MYNISICLLTKDEQDYINEFLEWHINIGVDHFYIYDNSEDFSLHKYVNNDFVHYCTFIDYSKMRGQRTQINAYNDCLNKVKDETKWLAFIDTDEFIRITDGRNIKDFLKDYEQHDGLYIKWLIYNANGQIHKDNRPQRERFTNTVDYKCHNWDGKSIIQPKKIKSMDVHTPFGNPRIDFELVDENHNRIYDTAISYSSRNKIILDHYFTRSYDEYVEKLQRGNIAGWIRKMYEFFDHNEDLKGKVGDEYVNS